MSNVLSEEQKQQVLALGGLGWSMRRIEQETGIYRETAARYLRQAGIAVRRPGRPSKETAKPAISTVEVTPDSEPPSSKPAITVTTDFGAEKAPGPSTCEPFREIIKEALARGRNAKAIWQDLVDTHSFAGSYQSVKRFVRRQAGPATPDARAVIITPPGEEAQVDYGTGPLVRDPATGKYRRTRLFVLTLGFSRKCVRLLCFHSSARTWSELHETAFRRLGGTPKVLVLDNLGEGVLKADFYDPAMNPLYRDVLNHYGACALPCRVNDPDRKGKVERGVGHAKRTPLKGQCFETLAAAQAYLDHWEERWADTRIHGTTKRQVAVMFAEEKPALQPLPIEPFRYYQFGERRVHLDSCVEVEAAYYSAPPRWIGRTVQVQWDERFVRLLDPGNGQLLREHVRRARGIHHIHEEDRSKRTPLAAELLLVRTRKAGPSIGAFCQTLLDNDGQVAIRRIQGVLAMAKRYGAAATDEACRMALEMGVHKYPFVRRYLEKHGSLLKALKQADPIIRQLDLYLDVIAERTKENAHESD
jgi:transposase